MTTMNISLPDSLKAFVDEQVAARGYASASEYLRELIRHERERLHFRSLIEDGFASGPAVEVEEDFFEKLRASIRDAGTA